MSTCCAPPNAEDGDHHDDAELEYRRSARRRRKASALPPTVFEGYRTLKSTYRKRQDGHFDDLLSNRRQRTAEKTEHFHVLFHHLQHWDGESLHKLKADATVLPNTPLRLGILQASPVEEPSFSHVQPWADR